MNLKIKVPEGHVIDQEKSTFENIVFKKVDNEKAKEKRFLELFQGLTMKSDIEKYPDSVFYFRDDKIILDIRKHKLFVSYKDIWCVFEKELGMEHSEIQSFIKTMVEKHFKWVGLTPFADASKTYTAVEKHFKWVGLTPKQNGLKKYNKNL